MTTKAQEELYRAQHELMWGGKPCVVYNPHNRPAGELPRIYGFNNGGEPGWLHAVLLAESGHCLGSHICSHEVYMPYDLGVIEGGNDRRHETFMAHYPDGYVMEFVGASKVRTHKGLLKAYDLNQQLRRASES